MPSVSLANGVIPTTQGVLFSCDRPVSIYSINIYSNHATQQVVYVYVRRRNPGGGTTVSTFRRRVLSQHYSAEIIENRLDLSVGDTVEAVTTTANAVEYVISGYERDRGI